MPSEEQLTHHLDNRSRFIATVVGEVFGPGSGFEQAGNLLADPTPYDLSQPAFLTPGIPIGKCGQLSPARARKF